MTNVVMVGPGSNEGAEEKDGFQYSQVICVGRNPPHPIAMVRWPEEVAEQLGGMPDAGSLPPGHAFLPMLKNKINEQVPGVLEYDEPFKVTRYEMHACIVAIEKIEEILGVKQSNEFFSDPNNIGKEPPKPKTPEEVMAGFDDLMSVKHGYVYLPKFLRDGRHDELYTMTIIPKSDFEYHVGRGMYEEVVWSPNGDPEECWEMEKKNIERNPMLREWE